MIKDNEATNEVRFTLQRFQDGYTTRDVSRLDEFILGCAGCGKDTWARDIAGGLFLQPCW